MNPIFIEYYPHTRCDCFKIKLPWTKYREEKIVLCEVFGGLDTAKKLAREEFAKHLHNVAKKLDEDEETGSKRYIYVKLGVDHFRHAFNYEAMARQNLPNLLFPKF